MAADTAALDSRRALFKKRQYVCHLTLATKRQVADVPFSTSQHLAIKANTGTNVLTRSLADTQHHKCSWQPR